MTDHTYDPQFYTYLDLLKKAVNQHVSFDGKLFFNSHIDRACDLSRLVSERPAFKKSDTTWGRVYNGIKEVISENQILILSFGGFNVTTDADIAARAFLTSYDTNTPQLQDYIPVYVKLSDYGSFNTTSLYDNVALQDLADVAMRKIIATAGDLFTHATKPNNKFLFVLDVGCQIRDLDSRVLTKLKDTGHKFIIYGDNVVCPWEIRDGSFDSVAFKTSLLPLEYPSFIAGRWLEAVLGVVGDNTTKDKLLCDWERCLRRQYPHKIDRITWSYTRLFRVLEYWYTKHIKLDILDDYDI